MLWIISELFPPEETSTAYIMGEIANAFSSKYEVGVICGPEIYDESRKRSKKGIQNDRIQIYRAEVKTFNKNSLIGKARSFISTSISLYRLAKKLIKEGDKVLIVTNPAPLILFLAKLRTSRDFQLNVLVHDVFPENTKAANILLPFYGVIKSTFDKAYSRVDQLIAIGRDMAEILVKKTDGSVPIQIIENWGDFETIYPREIPDNKRIILEYAGNIGRVQGLEDVINQLPDEIDFHLYGSGALENKLKKFNKSNVYFHGPYGREEQTDVLGACHISLVTLNKKMYGLGTPSKTYNILASGRPILYLGPQNSEIGLLVKENNIGYCGWPKVWDIKELRIMGHKAREVGERQFSKEVILKKFLDII